MKKRESKKKQKTKLSHHRRRDGRDEVGRLRPDFRLPVVQPPLDRPADLGQVGLGPATQARHDGAEAVEDDPARGRGGRLGVVRPCSSSVVVALLLVGVERAVDEELLEPRVDVGGPLLPQDAPHGVHHQPAVGLGLVLQVLDDAGEHAGPADLARDLDGRLQNCLVRAAVERHTPDPKVLEEAGQHLVADVGGRDAVGADALGDDFEDDALHLVVRGGELAEEDDHDLLFFCSEFFFRVFFGKKVSFSFSFFSLISLPPSLISLHLSFSLYLASVVVGVGRVHQRDDVSDRLEVRRQGFTAQQPHSLPQRLQDVVERVDAVGGCRLRQGRQREPGHRPDLGGSRVRQPAGHHGHERAQVGQHAAAQQDRRLLHDLDPGVPRLPRLFRAAHRLEEGEQGRDAEGRGDDGEGAGGGVADVLVDGVDVLSFFKDFGFKRGKRRRRRLRKKWSFFFFFLGKNKKKRKKKLSLLPASSPRSSSPAPPPWPGLQ